MLQTLILLGFLVSAQASPGDWQGTWGKVTADPRSNLTLERCADAKCGFRLRGVCSMDGKAELAGEKAFLVPSGGLANAPFEPNPYGCKLPVTLSGATIKADPLSEACKNYCVNANAFPSVYPRLSEKTFHDRDECFGKQSAGWAVWCVTEEFAQKEEELSALKNKIYEANPGKDPAFDDQFLPKAIAACEAGGEPIKACLLAKYKGEKAAHEALLEGAKTGAAKFEKDFAAPGQEADGDALISKIDGVYKKSFKNGLVDGSSYTSEDVLEIVRVSKTSIYFKVRLNFFNGHECNAAGLAKYSALGTLNYQNEKCRLSLGLKNGSLTIDDHGGTCREYCGARGSLAGTEFPLAKRRPIKYMERLKNSADYKEAVDGAGK
jgi:hypothetical protein